MDVILLTDCLNNSQSKFFYIKYKYICTLNIFLQCLLYAAFLNQVLDGLEVAYSQTKDMATQPSLILLEVMLVLPPPLTSVS